MVAYVNVRSLNQRVFPDNTDRIIILRGSIGLKVTYKEMRQRFSAFTMYVPTKCRSLLSDVASS